MNLNNLKYSGTAELTVRKTEVATTRTPMSKLSDHYDAKAKLVFLFDVSGSMGTRIAETYTDQYIWSPELLADIRARVSAATQLVMTPMGMLPEDEHLTKLFDRDPSDPNKLIPTFTPKDDEDLKERIVRADLIAQLGIQVDFTKPHHVPPTRLDVVRRLAKSEIHNRLQKYPDSHIAMIAFASTAETRVNDGKEDELMQKVDDLRTGLGVGTDIMNGLREALEACRQSPSQVGIHHLIVVTDGEDRGTYRITEWLPVLKASGVVLDYIHIGDSSVNQSIADACKALGGESVVVNDAKDLETKFIAAVGRKMLPAASV